jgi:hypothetical protein
MNDVASLSPRLAVILNHVGAKMPLMLTSRSDPPATRLISAAIPCCYRSIEIAMLNQTVTGDKP